MTFLSDHFNNPHVSEITQETPVHLQYPPRDVTRIWVLLRSEGSMQE